MGLHRAFAGGRRLFGLAAEAAAPRPRRATGRADVAKKDVRASQRGVAVAALSLDVDVCGSAPRSANGEGPRFFAYKAGLSTRKKNYRTKSFDTVRSMLR